MTKGELVGKIREILKTDNDLSFLLQLKKKEVETLIACIRDRGVHPEPFLTLPVFVWSQILHNGLAFDHSACKKP